MEELGHVAGDDGGAPGPDGDAFFGIGNRGFGNVDAVVLGDVGICEGVRREPGIAAAEINDAERLGLIPCPRGELRDKLGMEHVVAFDDGVVHRTLLERLFDAGEGMFGHRTIGSECGIVCLFIRVGRNHSRNCLA